KLIGDGTIVEFGSVVDAVNCALSVQRSNGALPDEPLGQPKIVLRIGINLGDVIMEGDDIYVKNIDRPIRVWKWHPGKTDVAAAKSNAAKSELNGATASIAILPF